VMSVSQTWHPIMSSIEVLAALTTAAMFFIA
jgi:hypothetical protein